MNIDSGITIENNNDIHIILVMNIITDIILKSNTGMHSSNDINIIIKFDMNINIVTLLRFVLI